MPRSAVALRKREISSGSSGTSDFMGAYYPIEEYCQHLSCISFSASIVGRLTGQSLTGLAVACRIPAGIARGRCGRPANWALDGREGRGIAAEVEPRGDTQREQPADAQVEPKTAAQVEKPPNESPQKTRPPASGR